jgi:putative transposase
MIRRDLKDVFHRLAKQKACVIAEGALLPDHVHMLITIPPQHSGASILGFLQGKRSIGIAQNIANKQRNFAGHKFWARGYFVSTVGVNEKVVRAYIENQEKEDRRLDDLFNRS